MTTQFTCPHCGHQEPVHEGVAGRMVNCPACGGQAQAPALDSKEEVVSLDPQAVTPPPPAPPPPPEMALRGAASAGDGDGGDEENPDKVTFSAEARDESEMDMTPMVDVTFLLLIFFMITAAFSLQKSIEVPKITETDQPSTQVKEEEDEKFDTITVVVDQFNTFRVITPETEEEAPSRHDLLRKIRQAKDSAPASNPPTKLLVRAHGDATHERVVIALDAGVEAGMGQVQLMTFEEDI